ncbi:MAG: hypothetical protein GF353_03500, partial [Candidatus Lokiarchaeota archaeon]|nr:hypothetical protein [Candidatus Lokiarchaeota archaeon]
MGAFFLYKNDIDFDLKSVDDIFTRKEFSKPKYFNLGEYKLWLYKKQLIDEQNYYYDKNRNSGIFSVGTLVYKSGSYSESLKKLFNDFNKSAIDYDELIGSYAVLFYSNNKPVFLIDPLNIQNIFYTKDQQLISNSFLALMCCGNYDLNKIACLENLTSGCITGDDTMVHGIRRYHHLYYENDQTRIPFLKNKTNVKQPIFSSNGFHASVSEQVELLRTHFSKLAGFIQEHGVDIGLSGGFDSRLLLALLNEIDAPVSVHTHWKKFITPEEKIAKLICQKKQLALKHYQITETADMSSNQLESNLEESCLFYDGHARVNFDWLPNYRTKWYRQTLLGDFTLGMNGIAGEQYRNYDNTLYDRQNFREWLKFRHIGYNNIFALDKDGLNYLTDYLSGKISHLLGINPEQKISKLHTKRYHAEIWVPSGPGIRNNAENQISYFMSPFTERYLLQRSYQIVPYLGIDGKFEAAMINSLDRELAGIPSSYGIDFQRIPAGYTTRT